jgi:endonuclease YncB( thermonuclease family)
MTRSAASGIVLLAALAASIAHRQGTQSGQASSSLSYPARVIEGETIVLGRTYLRLFCIDAPERRQSYTRAGQPWRCGDEVTAALKALVSGRVVQCARRDVDRYGRVVATRTVGGEDAGTTTDREGWALDYRHYSGGLYAAGQRATRDAHVGLWQREFVAPWDWRHTQR